MFAGLPSLPRPDSFIILVGREVVHLSVCLLHNKSCVLLSLTDVGRGRGCCQQIAGCPGSALPLSELVRTFPTHRASDCESLARDLCTLSVWRHSHACAWCTWYTLGQGLRTSSARSRSPVSDILSSCRTPDDVRKLVCVLVRLVANDCSEFC